MIKLQLSMTYSQMKELKEHLYFNGYHVDWEEDDIITIDEDEYDWIKTILYDRGIGYVEL